ncbi:PspA-associated protein PspAB [Streptomyces sp. B21-083]|uniref:PspA-associated protein PspAB n=1 Tax=Streptomyces sp. B21-083 TaxID=3039410 RepID=UPI002FF1F6C3
MGLLDILLGRTRPVAPDLDRLFGLPSAAVTLQAAAGFTPTGRGSVCFATVEGPAFDDVRKEVQALLDADAERTGPPVELVRDEYGYSWLVSRRGPEDLPALVGDLHAVNSALEASGFGPQLLCSVVGFEDVEGGGRDGDPRRLGLVYLYKRGTFFPFSPLTGGDGRGDGQRRDSALELQVRAALAGDLRIEQDLSRWFPVWGAPGL